MINLELWPWGVAIIVLLSMLIGWFAREIYRRYELNRKDEIIQAQEKEYIKLADQHVEKNQALKKIIADLEDRLKLQRIKNDDEDDPLNPFGLATEEINELFKDVGDQRTTEGLDDLTDEETDPVASATGDSMEAVIEEKESHSEEEIAELLEEETSDTGKEEERDDLLHVQPEIPSEEDSALVRKLRDQIDHLRIDKQKLLTVPQALYIEKNAALKKEIKGLKKKLNQTSETIDHLKSKLKKYKKKLKKRERKNVELVEVHEHIDFKELKKLLRNIPTKKTRVVKKDKRKKEKLKKKAQPSPE